MDIYPKKKKQLYFTDRSSTYSISNTRKTIKFKARIKMTTV